MAQLSGKNLLMVAAGYMGMKGIQMMLHECEKKKKEEIRKALECKIEKAVQEFKDKMKTLKKSFTQLQESKKYYLDVLRAYLNKTPGNKKGDIAWALEYKLKKNFKQLSQRIQTLEDDVQKWPEDTMYELLLLRAYLEKTEGNKEEEIAWALEYRLKKNLQQLSQKIRTLEEDMQEWSEDTIYELLPLRADLERKQGNKEGETAWALEYRLKKNLQLLSQRTPGLEEDVQELSETAENELHLLRADL